jgi:predicted enzyme related to lactoylglutathione lyase
MSHPVTFFEIVGPDPAALRDFFVQAFGWTAADVPGMPYTTFEPEPGGIAGGVGGGPDPSYPGHVMFYVSTDDLDATVARIEALGGSLAMAPVDIPQGRIAHAATPDGQRFGLWAGAA